MLDYFVRKKDNPDYHPIDPQKFKHVDEILKLMSVLTQDERFVDVMEGGKPENMCDVLDRVEARGEARGIAKGIIDTLASLVKKGLLSLTDAAKEAGMTPDDFKKKAGLT